MRDIVHRIKVTDGSRDPGAASCFIGPADYTQVGDTAARLAEREVANVIVARTDNLPDNEACSRGARTSGDLRLREASCGAAGSIWTSGQIPGIKVEQVIIVDERHADRE